MTFEDWLTEQGYTDLKRLDEKRWAGVFRFMFAHAIIVGEFADRHTYLDRWCYKDYAAAKAALEAWNGQGEPKGWHRHPMTGRRRTEGDEYVNF